MYHHGIAPPAATGSASMVHVPVFPGCHSLLQSASAGSEMPIALKPDTRLALAASMRANYGLAYAGLSRLSKKQKESKWKR